jgi:pimeloyl-ACP methyl ester carboxylesterase
VPTLVIHGIDDPLVPVEGGKDTAAHIEGAELMLVPGMGHDNPRPVWPQAVEAISSLTRRAARAEVERTVVRAAS